MCNYFRDLDVGTVICRQLGYRKVAKMYDYPYFGQGSGPVWIRPRCVGNETSLGHCQFWRWNVYDWWCTHEHDAGVVCTNGKCMSAGINTGDELSNIYLLMHILLLVNSNKHAMPCMVKHFQIVIF